MTRETKIGLLVGLAFIIVIGILLSDHLTSTNEPQQAQLATAGGNVRSAVTVPGAGTSPIATNTTSTQRVAPQQPVPTKEELTPKQPGVEIVQIGAGSVPSHSKSTRNQPQNTQVAQADGDDATNLSAEQGVTGMDSNSTPTPRDLDSKSGGSLANVAHTFGQDVVPVGGHQNSTQTGNNTSNNAQLPAGAKQYKVEVGDNLAKIATKTMGSASKANIAAIIAANASLQQNPNLIIAGRTYVIPGSGSAIAAVTTSSNSNTPSTPKPTQVATNDSSSSSDTGYFYVVKPGDSLTRIAMTQLGTPGAVEAIKDLNKDMLKGGDVIQPNMKLRLPAKPLASASLFCRGDTCVALFAEKGDTSVAPTNTCSNSSFVSRSQSCSPR